ncbi:MAG: MAPEG family protein [Steroidobacteraceae bacterium]
MNRNLIFYPVIVLVAMTLATYAYLLRVKVRENRAGRVNRERWTLDENAWPDAVRQVNNNLRNQFELPVLFYVVCVVLWELEAVGVAALAAAWLFVLTRVAHAWIHMTSNRMRHRARAFQAGWWVLAFMVLLVLWHLVGHGT